MNGLRPLIRFDRITKRFPGVVALDNVGFEIQPGHCHALVGENGAGKSTLGRILAGIYEPDGGRILLRGRAARFDSPLDAMRAGIGIVHQELAFCPNLTVAENLCLSSLPSRWGFLDRATMRQRARDLLGQIGAKMDVDQPVGFLSTAAEQMVQIAAAVGVGSSPAAPNDAASIIIMDEPTSSLSQAETDRLFDLIGRLRRRGATLIYISHRLEEVFRLCDMVTVLRDGHCVKTLDTAQTNQDEVVQLMIGRSLAEYFPSHLAAEAGGELLRVEKLSSPGRFKDISFSLRAGEVLGLAGLVGSGRSEIARAVFGLDPQATGQVFVRGRPTRIKSPGQALPAGIGYLPEDRKRQGLVLSMGGRANLSLPILNRLRRLGLIRQRAERALAREYFDRLRVRASGIDAPVMSLSGGNQQKIALAKWLASRCQILLIDEPTRGVDVGAKAEIHALIDELARAGAAVLMISSELPEILNLSTRIIVLRGGRLVGHLSRREASEESLIRLMAGVQPASAA